MFARKLFTLRFYEVLYFLVPQLILFGMPYVTGDLGFWAALGRDILAQGKIITQDSYSVLATKEMIYPSWGISVIYGLVDKLGGLEALYIFHRLLFLLFQVLVYRRIKHLAFSNWRNGAMIISATIGAAFFCDRPAMVPMVFLVLLTPFLKRQIESSLNWRLLLAMYLIVTVWANTHGSALFALIYLGMFGFYELVHGRLLNKVPLFLALSLLFFLATITTPFGWEIYPYSIETALISKQRMIAEWDSPTLPTKETLFEVSAFYVLGIIECVRRFKKFGIRGLAHPIVLSFAFGITSIRNVIWFFWTYLALIGDDEGLERETAASKKMSSVQKVFVIAMSLSILSLIPPLESVTFKFLQTYVKRSFMRYNIYTPYEAAEIIASDSSRGAIFNEFELGGYLIYRLGDKNKIFMDGRNIIYFDDDFELYKKLILAQEGYLEILNSFNFEFVLVKNRTRGIGQELRGHSDWQVLYDDGDDVLFKRVSSQ